MVMFTLEAMFIRMIGPDINAPQLALLRCIIQFALPLRSGCAARSGWPSAATADACTSLRGMLSAIGSVAYFYVFANLPLATATVIFFGNVIFTTMAAGPLLGETVGWRRWTATSSALSASSSSCGPHDRHLRPAAC